MTVIEWGIGVAAALVVGTGLGWGWKQRRTNGSTAERSALIEVLVAMAGLLHEMSPDQLDARGGWDQGEFARVLRRVERLTPDYQSALTGYLSTAQPPVDCLEALLAVDRLSAAYTYWTRLFPPREGGESMFILSLLHDLGEKVERAITLVQARP